MLKHQSLVFVSVELFVGVLNVSGQIAISTGTYSQAFNTLASSGTANTWTDNITLPGWYASQGATSTGITTYRASAGSDSAGAIYSFGSSLSFGSAPITERALGSLPVNATGSIAYGVRFTNNTASAVTQFAVSYTGEQWRGSGGGTPQSLAFAYRIASGPWVNPESGSTSNWVSVPALDFTSPNLVTSGLMDGNLATNRLRFQGIVVNGLNLLPGQELFLRWLDVNDSGNDHGLAVDDLTVFFPTNRPQIVAQPQSRTNLVGSTATFKVNALGDGIAYQWRQFGTNLSNSGRFSGVNTDTLTITSVQTNDDGNFTVVLTNSGGAVTSAVAVLTVPSGPYFLTHPASQTVTAGTNVLFTSLATGSAPLQYQWLLNEVPLPGQTSGGLRLTNVQAGNAGDYRVVVTNLGGAATSLVANLTVTPAAPWVLQQPVSEGVLLGADKRFFADVRGTEPLFYQWQRDNTDLPGAIAAELILTNVTEAGVGSSYRVVVTNSLGGTNSVAAAYGLVSLLAWGDNSSGQTAIAIAATNAVALASSYYANVVLTTSGRAVTWGTLEYGDITPPPEATNLVAVAVGDEHFLAARSNGTVVAWGDLLSASLATSVPGNATNVIAVAAGVGRSLALRANGTIVGWGLNTPGEAGVQATLTDAKAIAAGAYHKLALRSNGTVVAWGDNFQGITNVPAGLNSVRAIAAGESHSLALRSNGTVVAWGSDGGYGVTNVPSSATNIVAIAAGRSFSLALRSNGTLLTWPGSNMNPPPGTSNILAIAAGPTHALALIGPPLRIDPAAENFAVTSSNAQLRLTGLVGTGPVRIEASTNLVNWEGVATNPPATSVLRLTVPTSPTAPAQFFRATEKR